MVTLDDVAKVAGVSAMTVSRVINNPEKVRRSTIEKVNGVIEQLGYRPNLLAKSLVVGKTKTIGIISSNMYNQVYTAIITAIEEIANKEGFVIINADVNTYSSAANAFDLLLGNKVDGIILLPLEMNIKYIPNYKNALLETYKFLNYFEAACRKYDVKAVTVSQEIEGMPNIAFDFVKQCDISVRYLISKGYRKIAMINCYFPEGLWMDKENRYIEIMNEHGLSDNVCVEKDVETIEGGKRAMKKLLEKNVPEAVYGANDIFAAGAIHAIYENGLKIPEDIAVIGNDDFYICNYLYPRLTSVALGAREAGTVAIRNLLSLLGGETVQNYVVKPSLVERDSV